MKNSSGHIPRPRLLNAISLLCLVLLPFWSWAEEPSLEELLQQRMSIGKQIQNAQQTKDPEAIAAAIEQWIPTERQLRSYQVHSLDLGPFDQ